MSKTPGVAFYGKVRIPTIGHAQAIEHARGIAKKVGGKLSIGLSGAAKPLGIKVKKAHAQKIFGQPVDVGSDHTKNIFAFLAHLHQRHNELHLVAGSDRAPEYRDILDRYNGKPDKEGKVNFAFKKWQVHEVPGERVESNKDPRKMSRQELVQSVSASKLERLANEGNWPHFKAYHPGMEEGHVRKVYDQIRKTKTLSEAISHEQFGPMLDSFTSFAADYLKIKNVPKVGFKKPDEHDVATSFGGYNPKTKEIILQTKNRQPMDIFRTLAHELVHAKQHEDDKIGHDIQKEGETGSCHENEANAVAGVIMRHFGRKNPDYFELEPLKEAVFVVGGPCSGKDKVVKYLAEAGDYIEYDINEIYEDAEVDNTIIVNASADNFNYIKDVKHLLEEFGFSTSMVFVDVSNDISKIRNEQRLARGQRMINESVRFTKFNLAEQNKDKFMDLFEEDILVVDNSLNEACWKGYRRVKGKTPFSKGSCVKVSESLHDWFKSKSPKTGARGWVQVGGKYDGYPCARQPGQTSTPKCRSSEERAKMSKKQKEYAFKKKNREDPRQPEKKGGAKPTMVKTYKQIREDNEHQMVRNQLRTTMDAVQRLMKRVKGEGELEAWVQSKITKAADYIDSVADYLGSQDSEVKQAKSLVKEAKDACYHKVKARYNVFPSAYASGALVKCRKVGAANWGTKSKKKSVDEDFEDYMKNPANREWGKTSTTKIYADATPGQTFPFQPLFEEDCGCDHEKKKKKKFVKKKLTQEAEGNSKTAYVPTGTDLSAVGSGVGPTATLITSPSTIGGLAGSGTGAGVISLGVPAYYGGGAIAESVIAWASKPETRARFIRKYGDLAEQKLHETIINLNESIPRYPSSWPTGGSAGMDSGTVAKQGSKEEVGVNMEEDSWSDTKYQNPKGGLTKAGVMKYRAENPGSKLQTAVRTKPSKLKRGSKSWKRRRSFCKRMEGMKRKLTSAKTARDPDSRINKSLRAWNCEE